MAKLLGKIAIYLDEPADGDRPEETGSHGLYNHEKHEYDIHIRGIADASRGSFIKGGEPSIMAHELGHAIANLIKTPAENNWKKVYEKYFEPFARIIGAPQPHNGKLREAKILQEREAWEIGGEVLKAVGAPLDQKLKKLALKTYDTFEL